MPYKNVSVGNLDLKVDTVTGAVLVAGGAGGGGSTDMGPTNTLLTSIRDNADTVEALLTTLNGYNDGIETLQGATNTKLDSVITALGNTGVLYLALDTVEALLGTANTNTSALAPAAASTQSVNFGTSAAASTTSIDTSTRTCVGIVTPGTWTTTAVGFDVSLDNANWVPLYAQAGGEYQVLATAANRAYPLDPSTFAAWRYIRARSVTTQTAATSLSILSKNL